MHIVLASASPRRKEIFSMFGLSPEICVSSVDESYDAGLSPEEVVKTLSYKKGEAVAGKFPDAMVVSADTVVAFGGEILGKPCDESDAVKMLKSLSGTTHEVWTGYTVFLGGKSVTCAVLTKVRFKSLSHDEILSYVKTGEALDKAGSYGAQGKASVFVEGIEGDFFNVVGFPLSHFYDTVKREFHIDLWKVEKI